MNFQSTSRPAMMTALMIGNETLLIQCAELWRAAGHQIGLIITQNADIAAWANDQKLPVTLHDGALSKLDVEGSFDWLLSIANLHIIPDELLARAGGAVNFHDGPLPAYAGLNAPVWARLQGETHHAISWHLIGQGIDTGDILVEQTFEISESDTALTLNTKCFSAAMDSFPSVITALEAGAKITSAQDLSDRGYYGKNLRPAAQGRLDFRASAKDLTRLVRGLDHGEYWNPLTTAKLSVSGRILAVKEAETVAAFGAVGEVLEVTPEHVVVACSKDAIKLSRVTDLSGQSISAVNAFSVGQILTSPENAERLNDALQAIVKNEESWRKRLGSFAPVHVPLIRPKTEGADWETLAIDTLAEVTAAEIIAALSIFARQSGAETDAHLAFVSEQMTRAAGYLADWVPMAISAAPDEGVSAVIDRAQTTLGETTAADTFANDLILRAPELSVLSTPDIALILDVDAGPLETAALNIMVRSGALRLRFDRNRLPESHAQRLVARLETILARLKEPDALVQDISAIPDAERKTLLESWNATETEVDFSQTIHASITQQALRTPDATAVVFAHDSLSYNALEARANQLAHVLHETGVRGGDIVGVHCRRSLDLVVACLAVLKLGAAYLPLDPGFPEDRLAIYVEDSAAKFIVSQSAIAADLPDSGATVVQIDTDPRLSSAPETPPAATVRGEDLAYLIFTSGSTGRPKGVMVEHRNVANFFAGMDAVIPRGENPVWMAVTSLSFDISVLELFYTLARGYKLVISADESASQISDGPLRRCGQGMDFSLYYWGNDDGAGRGKYDLLLEGAKFADQNGFCAVWTPERHFHAFGGPYPNPSVTGAAVAAVTQNIGVRAGSCVAPLHHTARIAEEWAVIDNLTNGQAGLAIASGWQPDDFVLRPENTPPANKPAMFQQIADLRKLWRGEPVAFPRKDGALHEVLTQPRPVSKHPAIWVTTAGNPDTWTEAGRNGCHVLTHLLGQSIPEVAEKIKLYRAALRDAGHDPAAFQVTLMLHTFVGEDRDVVRETAREPMKDYLRSAAGLIKQYAWAFPAFKKPKGVENAFQLDLGDLNAEELEGILDFAFQRYFEDSGLFGTVDDCVARVDALTAIGVDEIACLIDYGIAKDAVLEGLRPLAEVVAQFQGQQTVADSDLSIAGQMVRHDVTHLQCTPSMARLLTASEEASAALGHVRQLMIGGEALSGQLVKELEARTEAAITNMYGPTETTIWSSTAKAKADEGIVNIGRPIANTGLYVLNESLQPVALGAAGELYIGGAGVTRGYWQRPDLTEARFVASPFAEHDRLYRTGDLVRARLDGGLDFIGRADHQVKIRGYRIELGEIESRLEQLSAVDQAVVIAREDTPGDVRLVAYILGQAEDAEMRAHLASHVPDYMVPNHFVSLSEFPLTPNKKVDRKALPKPVLSPAKSERPEPIGQAIPTSDAEVASLVGSVWSAILGIQHIGQKDNFFDLGGHSLLAVQAHRQLRETLGLKALSITDIFRFPTLGALVKRIEELGGAPKAQPQGQSHTTHQSVTPPAAFVPSPVSTVNKKAVARHEAMSKRRALRAQRKARQT